MTSAARRLRVTVLGTGHLGSRHAARLARNPGFELTAVHDRDLARAERISRELGCRIADGPREALEGAEAVVVATSTSSHFESAALAVESGVHVLVEKPLTGRMDEAETLVRMAEGRGVVLHVGHVERFNPALAGLLGNLPPPMFVESHRLASLVPRNLDIDVVQDLMIHDIDLALAFVGEAPVAVEAVGVAVLTERVDIANARLRFPGGAVANLTASRVSLDRVRKFRMFLPGTYVSADCAAGHGRVYALKEDREEAVAEALRAGRPVEMMQLLDHRVEGPGEVDALTEEHDAFRAAVLGDPSRGVTGKEALRALKVMVDVERGIVEGPGGM